MNKYLLLAILMISVSCGKDNMDSGKENNAMLNEPARDVSSVSSDKHEGQVLVEGANCLACHKVDAKLIGPSYKEIADKYTDADVDYLASKIIEGGVGVWGQVPMTPHPGMSEANAKKMVAYILTLKK